MSIFFDRLRSNPILDEIDPEKSNFSFGRSEGAPYLFFKGEELQDLMGHEIKFYNSGVLLVFKNKHKEHDNENSFMFFNNEGKQILSLSNIKDNGYGCRKRPSTNIDLIVRDGFIQINLLNEQTNQNEEYFVSIKEGKKIYDIFEQKDKEEHLTL